MGTAQRVVCERVPDGTHRHNGTLIVSDRNTIAVCEDKPRLKMYVGSLPPGWFLAKVGDAPPVIDLSVAYEMKQMVLDLLELTYKPRHEWDLDLQGRRNTIEQRIQELSEVLGQNGTDA